MLENSNSRTLYAWKRVDKRMLCRLLKQLKAPDHELVDPFLEDPTLGRGKLLVSLMQHKEAGDDAIRSAAGACAFVRRKRIKKSMHDLRERLCGRLFDTRSIVGLYRDDGMTDQDMAFARQLSSELCAVSFDGRAFRDKNDKTIVDVMKPNLDVDADSVMPSEVLACVWSTSAGQDTTNDSVASELDEAHILEKQMYYLLNAVPKPKEAKARLRSIRELLAGSYATELRPWNGTRNETWDELHSAALERNGFLVDGWSVWGADGKLWIDRGEKSSPDAVLLKRGA